LTSNNPLLEGTQQSLSSPLHLNLNECNKQGKEIHLSIVSRSQKVNIPLIRGTRKLKMVCHGIFLETCNIEQLWKSYLEGLISTPHVMPESNFGIVTYLKSSMT